CLWSAGTLKSDEVHLLATLLGHVALGLLGWRVAVLLGPELALGIVQPALFLQPFLALVVRALGGVVVLLVLLQALVARAWHGRRLRFRLWRGRWRGEDFGHRRLVAVRIELVTEVGGQADGDETEPDPQGDAEGQDQGVEADAQDATWASHGASEAVGRQEISVPPAPRRPAGHCRWSGSPRRLRPCPAAPGPGANAG